MKQFFTWLGKHIAGAMVFSLFSILFISFIVYAINYPSAPPAGEVAGGKFQANFNKIFWALVFTGGTVQIAHVATENTACTPDGLIARDNNGLILSCQGGVWKKGQGGGSVTEQTCPLGKVITGVSADGTMICTKVLMQSHEIIGTEVVWNAYTNTTATCSADEFIRSATLWYNG